MPYGVKQDPVMQITNKQMTINYCVLKHDWSQGYSIENATTMNNLNSQQYENARYLRCSI